MNTTPPRLAPAVVRGQQILIQCPSWCTIDHVAHAEGFLEDVWHCGDYADLMAPRMGKDPELALFARLGIDPYASEPARRKPFVTVDDGGEGYYMTPDMADEFAENLTAFAEKIRAMARSARDAA
ncbi:hypothetical protein [Streptomyces sp. ISL-94]|uniref:DUF6907 domain-containing protein n=1 Tax=Streptomyces sp. ISL-94 TaxID=2819190 RepID=UPI001BEBF9C1|nr:hypothetical protein [Streptomyces sp. ISL-94]MBT2477619.1 hypothetical protein [Streptomyces sp. ISL-94]